MGNKGELQGSGGWLVGNKGELQGSGGWLVGNTGEWRVHIDSCTHTNVHIFIIRT